MFIEKEKYFFIEEFQKYGVSAMFTKSSLGNMSDYLSGEINNITNLSSSENRKNFLKKVNLENKKKIYSRQTHSTNILKIDNNFLERELNDIDGFSTTRKDVVLITFYADCMPIYIYDIEKKAILISHSGWVGTFNNMLEKSIEHMEKEYKSDRRDLLIAFGPSIHVKDYEVDVEFYKKFKEKFNEEDLKNVFIYKNGKYFFNNMKLNENLALKYGIIKDRIISSKFDVISNNCHSYRRDKQKSGRSMGIISIS